MDQRVAIIGSAGSGKSMMGAHLLSASPFDKMPAVIIDYKYEKLYQHRALKKLVTELKPTSAAPRRPGLFIVHPLPTEVDEMEDFLWRIWDQGRTLVVVDEGYLLPDRAALQALLTTGRSKKIPMFVLSQRPVEMNRFIFSEANHYCIFRLNDRRDWQNVNGFTRGIVPDTHERQRYHSWWYDAEQDETFRLAPVPDADTIVARLAARAPRPLWG